MSEKEIVSRVADRIVTIVVRMLEDDKEVGPMKNAVAHRKSLRKTRVWLRSGKVDKGRSKVFALSQANIGTRAR